MNEEIKDEVECKDGVCEVKKNGECKCKCHDKEEHEENKQQPEVKQEEVEEFEESEEVLILKNTIENLNEKLKISQAENINYRRRKDEEVENKLKFANQDLIMEILPVLDSFDRAIKLQKNDDPNINKFLDGFKMLYTSLDNTLKKFGVEEIDCLGKEFDHNLHEAMLVDKDESQPDNVVLEVLIKGYTLKGRVIRAASVKVNKLD